MGVVIETCVKHPRGPTRITVTDIQYTLYILYNIIQRGINRVLYDTACKITVLCSIR
jgi:hypothetical protein